MVDIAPTLAALLGANIPATSQGHVLFDMLALSAEQKEIVAIALEAQQRQLHSLYAEAIGDPLPIREDMEFVTGTNFAIDAMLLQQQDKERRMRFNLPLALFVFPAYLIFRNWKKVRWLFSGAVAYFVLFNIYYAFIGKRTYSLSSVASLESFIQFNAVTAALLLGAIWLVSMLKLGTFKNGPRESAENTLLLTTFTLYLLSLPVLWNYAVNGLVTTWFLPNFPIMFRGFLALIQSIMLAAVGIMLTGISALVAQFAQKKS